MKKYMLIIIMILTIFGCATTKKMNQISLGMTKGEVISVMGDPDITKASEGVEYLIYSLTKTPSPGTNAACATAGIMTLGLIYIRGECHGDKDDYFVKLESGEVSAYGNVGDFDSTKIPEATLNINKTIKQVE